MHPKRQANPSARCPKVRDKEMSRMIAAAWAAGWWCEQRATGHVFCWPPDGDTAAVLVASTPSDYRGAKNTRAEFRRRGLTV